MLFTWLAVVANVTLPLKFPLPVGANVIVAEVAFPACSVSGRARLLIENPAPLSVAWVMVRSAPPLFERVTGLVWLDPTLMFPKVICEGLGESAPTEAVLLEPEARPPHPASSNKLPAITSEMTSEMAKRSCTERPFKEPHLWRPRILIQTGGFRVTLAQTISAPTTPVSRLTAASHRLRKAQLGAASGQRAPGQIPSFGMNCGAKKRNSARAYKLLLING